MRSRFLTYFVLLAVLIIAGCRAGIDPRQSGALTITFSGNGSGTEDDPLRIVKSSEVTFGATDADGNPVEVTWSVAGVSASVAAKLALPNLGRVNSAATNLGRVNSAATNFGEASFAATNFGRVNSAATDCGSFSGDTYTAPSGINGSGMCIITGTADFDPTASGSAYVRIMVGDTIAYDKSLVSDAGNYTITSSSLAASKGNLNLVLTKSAVGNAGGGTLIGSSYADVGASISLEGLIFETLFPDIAGLAIPTTISEIHAKLKRDASGRCYVAAHFDSRYPGFYASDDCAADWRGPVIPIDTIPGNVYAFEDGVNTDAALHVDDDGGVYMAWGDHRRDRRNLDICFDKCTRGDDGSYSCGTDVCKNPAGDTFGIASLNVVVYGEYINLFWNDHYLLDGDSADIMQMRSVDGGASFSEPEAITGEGLAAAFFPRAEADEDNGNIHLVYQASNGAVTKIYYAKSTDNGASFSAPAELGAGQWTGYSLPTVHPSSLGEGGDADVLIIGMRTDSETTFSIGYFFSEDDGDSWTGFTPIRSEMALLGGGSRPAVLSSGHTVYIAYIDDSADVYIQASPDCCAVWGDPIKVNDVPGVLGNLSLSSMSTADALAAGPDGSAYLMWLDGRYGDGENSFRDPFIVNCTADGCGDNLLVAPIVRKNPYLFVTGSDAEGRGGYGMLVTDGRSGSYDIYYYSAVFGENPEGQGVRVDDDTGSAHQTQPVGVRAADGTLYAVWYDQRGAGTSTADLYFSYSADGGTTWEANAKLNNDPFSLNTFIPPAIAVRGSDATVAWSDNSIGGGSYYDIYYREYSGGAWSEITNVTPNSPSSIDIYPSIAATRDGTVHMIYVGLDLSGGGIIADAHVYFRSKPYGGQFSEPVKIADGTVITDEGGNPVGFTAFPKIAADVEGRLTAIWGHASGGTAGGAVALDGGGIYWSRSVDSGATWTSPSLLTDAQAPSTGEASIISSMTADENGRIYILFSYGTGTAGFTVPTDAYLAVGQ